MTIIEAWKQATLGQIINRKGSTGVGYRKTTAPLSQTTRYLTDEYMLANDWEIIKQHKREVFDRVFWNHEEHTIYPYLKNNIDYDRFQKDIPTTIPTKVTIEWEE